MSFAVIFGAFGDISLSKGMKTIGSGEFPGMLEAMIAAVTNIHVISGVALLIVFMLLYLASLSWEDLTYVVPLTAGVYILVTILAYFLLHEDVSPLRWIGSFLVATGIVLVARTQMVEAGFTLGIAIVFAAMGDILFSKGMQAHGEVKVHCFWDIPPLLKHVFTNPLVLAGMGSMAINLASYVAALEYVDVSVANPITSLSYLVATLYMALIVRQRVTKMRWIGLFFITVGAICVGITS